MVSQLIAIAALAIRVQQQPERRIENTGSDRHRGSVET